MLVVVTDWLAFPIPQWVLLTLSVTPRLVYLFVKPSIDNGRNSRAAKAHGAVLPPHIDVNSIEVPKKLSRISKLDI
jgi:hypothetical protein